MQSRFQWLGPIWLRRSLLALGISIPLVALPRTVSTADSSGIWISRSELQFLPANGIAWNRLKSRADRPAGTPQFRNQNETNNLDVLAKALVYARTGIESYRSAVIDQCMRAIGTETGGRTLALGRKLVTYVIATDLVKLPPEKDALFKQWLRYTLSEDLDGLTLQTTHERRPNNWGTHAGSSRAAVAVYLADQPEIERTARVFQGWLGDREAYAGFQFGELSWQCEPEKPVGINARGCSKGGHSIDGVLPDDQRRSGPFRWPPPKENYVYEALQGAVVQAEILHRAGFGTYEWSDEALLRAFEWLNGPAQFPAEGDDTFLLPVIERHYQRRSAIGPARVIQSGKNIGWTDWTHSLR